MNNQSLQNAINGMKTALNNASGHTMRQEDVDAVSVSIKQAIDELEPIQKGNWAIQDCLGCLYVASNESAFRYRWFHLYMASMYLSKADNPKTYFSPEQREKMEKQAWKWIDGLKKF